jgi:RimJ/RimL family protein N-acetyltransferase
MTTTPLTLKGKLVCLEPLGWEHLPVLTEIAVNNPEVWKWTFSLHDEAAVRKFMELAFKTRDAGTAIPFAVRSLRDNTIVGTTRYSFIETEHRKLEIGYTWLGPKYQRTGINVEMKYLMLRHAFEEMHCARVALKTHHKNLKSQAAIRALGAVDEGTSRNHMVHYDGTPRHSVWFSILDDEWPQVKARLEERMLRHK